MLRESRHQCPGRSRRLNSTRQAPGSSPVSYDASGTWKEASSYEKPCRGADSAWSARDPNFDFQKLVTLRLLKTDCFAVDCLCHHRSSYAGVWNTTELWINAPGEDVLPQHLCQAVMAPHEVSSCAASVSHNTYWLSRICNRASPCPSLHGGPADHGVPEQLSDKTMETRFLGIRKEAHQLHLQDSVCSEENLIENQTKLSMEESKILAQNNFQVWKQPLYYICWSQTYASQRMVLVRQR